MDTRRKLLKKIGLGTAAAGLVIGGRKAAEAARAPGGAATATRGTAPDAQAQVAANTAEAGTGPWWLLAPLARGSHLGQGWYLAHFGAVQRGASVLTLQSRDGEIARVHVCQHDGAPRGLASTELLDLVLMDGGQGDKQTPEHLGRVLMGLARVMRENELKSDGDLGELARMQSHGERVDAYGPESLT